MPVIKEKKIKEIKLPKQNSIKEPQKTVNPVLVSTIVILLLIILVGAGVLLYPKIFKQENNAITWQAVFISSGQVYFGHVQDRNTQFVTLTDVYYLQIKENSSATTQLNTNAENTNMENINAGNVNSQNISLVQLGDELHGPQDKMIINRDHILFIEDLKADSSIIKTIDEMAKQKGK